MKKLQILNACSKPGIQIPNLAYRPTSQINEKWIKTKTEAHKKFETQPQSTLKLTRYKLIHTLNF